MQGIMNMLINWSKNQIKINLLILLPLKLWSMIIPYLFLWMHSKLEGNVPTLNILHGRKERMQEKHKENHIKKWQYGDIIFSCLFSTEFTQYVPYPLSIFRCQKSLHIHMEWVNLHILMFLQGGSLWAFRVGLCHLISLKRAGNGLNGQVFVTYLMAKSVHLGD